MPGLRRLPRLPVCSPPAWKHPPVSKATQEPDKELPAPRFWLGWADPGGPYKPRGGLLSLGEKGDASPQRHHDLLPQRQPPPWRQTQGSSRPSALPWWSASGCSKIGPVVAYSFCNSSPHAAQWLPSHGCSQRSWVFPRAAGRLRLPVSGCCESNCHQPDTGVLEEEGKHLRGETLGHKKNDFTGKAVP